MNETARVYEQRKFDEIAERFSKIPAEDVIDVRPEIGVPIIEALSATDDANLRSMFIELLAKAANRNDVQLAHPSFSRIIGQLSPDEAVMLNSWKGRAYFPLLTLSQSKGKGQKELSSGVIHLPDSVIFPDNAPLYLANLQSQGLIKYGTERYIPEDGQYDQLLADLRATYPDLKDGSMAAQLPWAGLKIGNKTPRENAGIADGDMFYQKGMIELTALGRGFQKACIV
nr:DUF4393 domain-containing protein [Croceicoccus gelatinilyticus]